LKRKPLNYSIEEKKRFLSFFAVFLFIGHRESLNEIYIIINIPSRILFAW